MTALPWSGLVVLVSEDRALISREGAALILRLVAGMERVARSEGIGLSPQLAQLRDVLQPMAGERHGDVAEERNLRSWTPDEITTSEAAQMLKLSTRQTQRLTDAEAFGPVRRVGRGYLIPRAEVGAYIARRKESE